MTTFVLDTGLLVGYLRGADYADYTERHFGVSTPQNFPVICVVSSGEVYSVALQFGWGEERLRRLGDLLRRIPFVDINSPQVIERYAQIDAYSQGKHPSRTLPPAVTSRNMGKNDVWIAATASVLQATLLTTDHDFDHLHGIFLAVEYIDQAWGRGGSP